MNCTQCDTPNDPSHKFCKNCGEMLPTQTERPTAPPTKTLPQSATESLGIHTARILIALLGLAILNIILTNLAFVKELSIPDFALSTPALVRAFIYIISVILLVGYARRLKFLWPQAYPQYKDAIVILNATLYLIVLVATYSGLRPIVLAFTPDNTVLTILQIVFLLVTAFIVGRACVLVYKLLPTWLKILSSD